MIINDPSATDYGNQLRDAANAGNADAAKIGATDLANSAPAAPAVNGNTITQAAAQPDPTMTDISSEGANLNVASLPPINFPGALSTAVGALGGNPQTVNPSATVTRPAAPTPITNATSNAQSADSQAAERGSPGGAPAADPRGENAAVAPVPTTPNGDVSNLGGVDPSVARANTIAKAQMDAMDAKTAQNDQQAQQARAAGNNSIIASYAQTQAEDRARVANNSAGGINHVRGSITAANTDLANKTAAATAARTAAGNVGSNRNYIQEAAQEQKLTQGAQSAVTAEQAGQQGVQKSAFELKHAGLVQDIAQRLSQAGPGTPEYKQLMSTYRVMTGKDANNFKTQVVPGGTRFDPANPTVPIKDPDRIVTQDLNDPNGQPHEVILGPQAGAATPPPADWVARAKQLNPGISDDQLAQAYASKKR